MSVLVIGLDCVPPALAFDRYRAIMPNLTALAERGTHGTLRSSAPPITVPAWTCMTTGRDPGELGIYGFRNRVEGSYALRVATARDVRHKRVFARASEAGHRVASLFVPLTSPPTPVRGEMVSGFLHQGGPSTFPAALEDELLSVGERVTDVDGFRSGDLARIEREIFAMTDYHFDVAEHIQRTRRPELAMMVALGPDRLHHAFWRYLDPAHPRFVADGPFAGIGERYYAQVDERLGRLIEIAGSGTDVLVVSDHGARTMERGVCINEFLMNEGWLVLEERPTSPTPFSKLKVDWRRTRAWAAGGYYSRVFLNVRGREPAGIVEDEDRARDELVALLRGMDGADVRVDVPEEVYRATRGFPPDLMVYFDDLASRALGSVGHGHVFVSENDLGEDGCNHDWNGILVAAGPGVKGRGRQDGAVITDVATMVTDLLGL